MMIIKILQIQLPNLENNLELPALGSPYTEPNACDFCPDGERHLALGERYTPLVYQLGAMTWAQHFHPDRLAGGIYAYRPDTHARMPSKGATYSLYALGETMGRTVQSASWTQSDGVILHELTAHCAVCFRGLDHTERASLLPTGRMACAQCQPLAGWVLVLEDGSWRRYQPFWKEES